MPNWVNMAVPSASPLFLREAEVRLGAELLFFGYSHLYRHTDQELARQGLGRAHHRALYFIAREPGLSVKALLRILNVTKQSLGRVLSELTERDLIETRQGTIDRRQRLLYLTDTGKQQEAELFETMRGRLATAYAQAGQSAVTGFWTVLEQLVPADERNRVAALVALDPHKR